MLSLIMVSITVQNLKIFSLSLFFKGCQTDEILVFEELKQFRNAWHIIVL